MAGEDRERGNLKEKWEINVVPFCPGAFGLQNNPVSAEQGSKEGAGRGEPDWSLHCHGALPIPH